MEEYPCFEFAYSLIKNVITFLIFQPYIIPIEQFILRILPGIIWFYYRFNGDNCDSPLDDNITLYTIYYYIIFSLFLILVFLSLYIENICCRFCFIITYAVIIITLSIIMVIQVQIAYNENWENNKCESLKYLTLFWLILNYILNFGLFAIFIIICFIYFVLYLLWGIIFNKK